MPWGQPAGGPSPYPGLTAAVEGGQASPAAPNQGTPDQQNAQTIVQSYLDSVGLGSLSGWAWDLIINGASAAQVQVELPTTPEFQARFPAIAERQKAGLPPISVAEYLSLERQYTQSEASAGLPSEFADKAHHDSLIAGDVSPNEYQARINQGFVAASQAPQEVRDALKQYYGADISTSGLAAFFLDEKKALPIMQRQIAAAQIGGAASRTGFGGIDEAQAERLAALGVSDTQAQTGFSHLAHLAQLEGTLPGQSQTAIGTGQLLGAEFGGDTATQDALTLRAEQQKALFAGAGRFSEGSKGVEGLGNANQG